MECCRFHRLEQIIIGLDSVRIHGEFWRNRKKYNFYSFIMEANFSGSVDAAQQGHDHIQKDDIKRFCSVRIDQGVAVFKQMDGQIAGTIFPVGHELLGFRQEGRCIIANGNTQHFCTTPFL